MLLMTFRSDFLHKVFNFEYWPAWVFYAPVYLLWPYFALKAKSLLFFTMANPCIPHGGSFGESKVGILKQLNPKYVPLYYPVTSTADLKQKIPFPVVAKPDIGERGDNIRLIHTMKDLEKYFQDLARPFIVQEYLDSPFEAGVMVYRNPHSRQLQISSIVTKDFLTVRGNGTSNLKELILQNPRSRFQWERLKKEIDSSKVLRKDEELLIEPIGNHCRGTAFINSNHLITPELLSALDDALQPVKEFYFGRFDLKAVSAEHLRKGLTIQIMELNGAFSEPGHIYDPNEKLWKAWRDLISHWIILSNVCRYNYERGFRATPFLEFARLYKDYKKLHHMRST